MFAILVSVLSYSCKQPSSTTSNKVKKDNCLLTFTAKMIYTVDSLEKLDNKLYQAISSSDFNSKTDTIFYLKNKIHISYLKNAEGCADYVGDIKINKDTLKLLFINISVVVCAEENTWRLVYEIQNIVVITELV
jgi:hypothetical protein